MSNIISIGSSEIRQIDGLYSLNDLHVASGGSDNFKPVFFLRNAQTIALIEEIKGADSHLLPLRIEKGRNGGTYACKELVIAYAAWISPAFHLKVIRVFLDSQQKQTAPSVPTIRVLSTIEQTNINLRAHVLAQEKYREIRGELMADYLAGLVTDLDKWVPQEKSFNQSIVELRRNNRYVLNIDENGEFSISDYPDQFALMVKAISDPLSVCIKDEQIHHLAKACLEALVYRSKSRGSALARLRGAK